MRWLHTTPGHAAGMRGIDDWLKQQPLLSVKVLLQLLG
jgi:hypothetical protein